GRAAEPRPRSARRSARHLWFACAGLIRNVEALVAARVTWGSLAGARARAPAPSGAVRVAPCRGSPCGAGRTGPFAGGGARVRTGAPVRGRGRIEARGRTGLP